MKIVHVDPAAEFQSRRACDRCHQFKLKCLPGPVGTCQRCLRAKAGCVFSPQAKSRSRRVVTRPVGDIFEHANERSTQEPAIPATPISSPAMCAHNAQDNPSRAPADDSCNGNDFIETDSLTFWMRKSSEMGMRLLDHLISLQHIGDTAIEAEGERQAQNSILDVDETIKISQSFIEILSGICLKIPPPENTDYDIGDDGHRLASFSLDPASELLIFSIYLRFIEIYDTTFRQMADHFQQEQAHHTKLFSRSVPELIIGTASIPSGSSTLSVRLITLLETMFTQVRKLIQKLSSPKITSGYRGDFNSFGGVSLVIVPDLALQSIRIRENTILRLLDQLKKLHHDEGTKG